MIEKEYGQFRLRCDICGETAPRRHEHFQDAVDYKKEAGWRSQRINNVWADVCPDCQ